MAGAGTAKTAKTANTPKAAKAAKAANAGKTAKNKPMADPGGENLKRKPPHQELPF